ncbi:TIGR02530 family flagellar biosynthesis protein [Salinibacillus xinjiangensis]|uniref:Flagellar protein n=1 Tax=Salinibacillus xinjiangensis TaxID=1229268 RepID=A0A6G1X3B5_9BACI|nr:TIGR02530 family flagellar biosynthesis protein [Salinibacillus xinjiangensis]MRG85395.1 flagellar protein [Salinibacillus xinjiangensis]
MDHRIQQLQNHPLHQHRSKQNQLPKSNQQTSFQSYLKEATHNFKVSKHAEKRLAERNINISDTQWSKIQHQMESAKSKGVTDSLVILNDAALVVSTKNNTVITAMDRTEATDHVFTNINGTILLNE